MISEGVKRRLDAVMELLHDYKLKILQIEYKVGFKSASFFSSSFKNRFDKSLREVMSKFINGRPDTSNRFSTEVNQHLS